MRFFDDVLLATGAAADRANDDPNVSAARIPIAGAREA
jgi:hypothetical protein